MSEILVHLLQAVVDLLLVHPLGVLDQDHVLHVGLLGVPVLYLQEVVSGLSVDELDINSIDVDGVIDSVNLDFCCLHSTLADQTWDGSIFLDAEN